MYDLELLLTYDSHNLHLDCLNGDVDIENLNDIEITCQNILNQFLGTKITNSKLEEISDFLSIQLKERFNIKALVKPIYLLASKNFIN